MRSGVAVRSGRRGVAVVVAVLLSLLVVGAAVPPDDPLVGQQAHLDTVRAFDAWQIRRGEGAVVAVLDTGVDLDHPDLVGRLVEGLDLVDPDTDPDDPQGHGTIVAGVIAAVAGNGRGVAGVAPQTLIMPIRVLDGQGRGTSDVVAAGIRHAIAQGVQVINLSLAEVEADDAAAGTVGGLSLVQDRDVVRAIGEAADAGILVVAAAGNDGRGRTPYRIDAPLLVVGATDEGDRVWEDSNYDDRTIFAPGVGILSTWNEQRYARSDGTSFATPIVAAGGAMLLGAGLDLEETRRRLIDTAVPVQGDVGLGRVDLAAAVAGLEPAPSPPPAPLVAAEPNPPADPPAQTPPAPDPSTPGPLEVAEPVQEVTEPPGPVPAQVTEAPPPVATQAIPSPEAAPTATASSAVLGTDPSATPTVAPSDTRAPPAPVESSSPDDAGRAVPLTVAAMLLGVDVLLAGWVLRGDA